MKIRAILITICFTLFLLGCQKPSEDYTTKIDDNVRAQQIKDMKFGMFICWSFSTFSGREWTPTLDKEASYFKATGCDTDQWCQTAKDAGMAYILFLPKHHDGFCLWDTKTTDKKVTNSPLGIDVLAKLRKSCDKYGIKLALYFSEGDWNWEGAVDGKGWRQGIGRNPDMKKAQLKELLTNYGPIEFWWMDHAVGDGGLSHTETVDWIHQFQPNSFVGFNTGEAAGRLNLRERGKPGPIGDKSTVWNEGHLKENYDNFLVAEFTYPILPPHEGGADWFYSLPKHDNLCKSAEKIYEDYIGAVKYGNIFSINVGPNYEGKLREVDVKTLEEVGKLIRAIKKVTHPEPYGPVPSENQVKWHEMEYYGLVCYGLNTYTRQEWGFGDVDPAVLKPTNLDTDQWARVAKESGMKGLILVAKHHDGFCLWPSNTTEYTIAATSWKNGKGDILGDLAASCKKYGLKLGIYISPWDRNHAQYGKSGYVEAFHEQWREALEYSDDVWEVWFDGANGGTGYYGGAKEKREIQRGYYQFPEIFKLIKDKHPNAIFFGYVEGVTEDVVRWGGTEKGTGSETNWCRYNDATSTNWDEAHKGLKDGKYWMPVEGNTTILHPKKWYYNESSKPRTLRNFVDLYYSTIGQNATFILGLSIGPDGQIPQRDVKSMLAQKKQMDRELADNLAKDVKIFADNHRSTNEFNEKNILDESTDTYWATSDSIKKASLVLDFGKAVSFNRLLLQEYIRLGQRIHKFELEVETEKGWNIIAAGTTIGYKRILRFDDVNTAKVRITFETDAPCLTLSNLEIYNAPPLITYPEISCNKKGFVKILGGKDLSIFYAIGANPKESDFVKYSKPFNLSKGGIVNAYTAQLESGHKSDIISKEFVTPSNAFS